MKKFALLAALFGLCNGLLAQEVSYFIQGHQDDWQLFMSKSVVSDMTAGKVVFITFTAGDAGNGKNAYGVGTTPYFKAREMGSIYSSKFVVDLGGTPDSTPVETKVVVNGHSITKYVYKNAVNYFFRFPDGQHTGVGYSTTGLQSLQRLQTNAIPKLMAVDSSATYVGWTDLVNTVKAIILNEKGTDNQIWINTPSLTATYNVDDHSDHKYSSRAAQDAVAGLSWVGIASFMDYESGNKAANLARADEQSESAIFGVCEWAMIERRYGTSFEPWHKRWLSVHYFQVTKTPSGNAPVTSLAGATSVTMESVSNLTEIPMTVAVSNPVNGNNKIQMILSIYEPGQLNTSIYDMAGKLVFAQNRKTEKGKNDIKLNHSTLQKGTYIIKNTLNNKYVESRKIIID